MDKSLKKSIFSRFIIKYFELLEIIKEKVTHNDFDLFYKKNFILKKTNIKIFIKTWYEYITQKYYIHIMNNNIDYFINNSTTIINNEYLKKYLSYFNESYKQLNDSEIKSIIAIIQELTQLSLIYYK
tara:strand:- start:477 stop:857 length:381 start_codon:yes stop_codon:yes gene_type:complete